MQTDLIAVPPFWTVGQTIDFMRETEDLPDTFYEIFVIDPGGRLLGSVPLDKLLRSKRPVTIAAIMNDDPDRVEATEPQEEVARLFERYNLVSAAVVDEANRLVGVMMVDDIVDVLEEEADADIKPLGGVKPDEELSDTVWDILKSRSTWLFVNLCTALLASSVIGMFEGSLQKMVALAVLMPIVASMGGNAGHADHDGRRAGARDARPRPRQCLAGDPPRDARRLPQRHRLRDAPRRRRGVLVRHRRSSAR